MKMTDGNRCWMLNFKPTFSFSSFTFIKRLFSSSSLSAIRVVSSAYLRLLIFLPAVLIPACASSSPAFRVMYSAYKLNNQGDQYTTLMYSFPNLKTACLNVHLLEDGWADSSFGLSQKLQWTFLCRSLCGCRVSFHGINAQVSNCWSALQLHV